MEKSENGKQIAFKGAGILLGLIIGSVAGIVISVLTGITGIIGAVAGAIAVPLGLSLENRFQGGHIKHSKKSMLAYIFLILSGLLVFFFVLLSQIR
ncbi:MAG TPA: hypothetical protein VJ963_10740 [Bacteroidales bacterium]|nr:hypothetical protein [Bacteroidales bacterium]